MKKILKLSPFALLPLSLTFASAHLQAADKAETPLQEQAARAFAFQPKPRVFVLTDIGNEPDDQMSLTRFLLYADELNIEGLAATTSVWQREKNRQDMIELVLGHYAQVQPNLLKHSPDYPAAAQLAKVVTSGQPGYGMAATGKDKTSDGSALLAKAIEKSTAAEPLNISVWGGANTLAQALIDLEKNHSAEQIQELTRYLSVYAISDQDDAGAWIRKQYPNISYTVDPSGENGEEYSRATWTGISGDKYYRNGAGADFTTVSQQWLDDNIRSKGPMGKGYLKYIFIMEGDTPAFLGLIQNGLNSYQNAGWGGWGGRYILRRPLGETRPIWTSGGDAFPGNPNAADTVIGGDGRQYTSNQATVWRWREAFQHDFAARMDWTVKDYKEANHNPLVVVDNDKTKQNLTVTLKTGESREFDASGTQDPDNDKLTYQWFIYPEASSAVSYPLKSIHDAVGEPGTDYLSAPPAAELQGDTGGEKISLKALKAGTVHLILAVKDDGSPTLTAYRRIIVNITE